MFNFSSLSYFQMGFDMPLPFTYIYVRQNIAFDTPLLFSGFDLSMSTFVPLGVVSYGMYQISHCLFNLYVHNLRNL